MVCLTNVDVNASRTEDKAKLYRKYKWYSQHRNFTATGERADTMIDQDCTRFQRLTYSFTNRLLGWMQEIIYFALSLQQHIITLD